MRLDQQQRASLERWRQRFRRRRFRVLLVILAVVLAGPPILLGFGLSPGWFDGLMLVLVLAAILSLCLERQQRIFALMVGIPSIVFSAGGHALSGTVSAWVLFIGHLCEVLFLFGAAALIVKSLFSSRSLTFDSIFGAVCGYLFLGLGWAVCHSMIENLRPGSFEVSPSLRSVSDPAPLPPDVLTYYSFVTLTTVGYGDVIPASAATRTFAWIEAITGQFYLAVIVAGLVSMLAAKAGPPSRQEPMREPDDAEAVSR
jgi:hypothetical protein